LLTFIGLEGGHTNSIAFRHPGGDPC
jgi:hypothetical protein